MTSPSMVWLDAQPSLYCFNHKLAVLLSRTRAVRRWSFQHDPDESCSMETIHDFLVQSLQDFQEPPHLIAHGLSGTIACLFAHRHPRLIRSLTVLSVDTLSCNHWHNHYLSMRSKLPCSRSQILSQLSLNILGKKNPQINSFLSESLACCLDFDFTTGSIVGQQAIKCLTPPDVPMLILNGKNDFVVDSGSLERWKPILKSGDCIDLIPQGRHFFHYSKAAEVAQKINAFIELTGIGQFPDFISSHTLMPINSKS